MYPFVELRKKEKKVTVDKKTTFLLALTHTGSQGLFWGCVSGPGEIERPQAIKKEKKECL